MLKNYIKIAFRNFTRDKSSFLINITGLSLGLAGSILILLWVMDERSVDNFHPDIDRIYQVMEHQAFSENINTTPNTPGVLAPALKEEIPEFGYVTTYRETNPLFSYGEKSFKSNGHYARPDIFNILSFHILSGNVETWLEEPNTLVLSENTAERYFSGESALGKQLLVNNEVVYTVAGVYMDFPANSTFRPDFIMPFGDFMKTNEWSLNWNSHGPRTLAKLHEGADIEQVNEKIHNFIREKDENALVDLFLYPYADQYLYNSWEDGRRAGGRIEYVRIFSLVAVIVLLIACINFMNLSTARSTKRAREVGIRKSIGASRGSLVGQYLGESVILSFFSLITALLLVELALPVFNNLTGKEIAMSYYQEPSLLLVFAGIALCTGLVAGSYPAFYLSAFSAVKTLKGTLQSPHRLSGETFARKGLVVFQFTLSIILIISTILIYSQVQYVQNKNLGYQKENLITFSLEGDRDSWWENFRQQALGQPGVKDVSRARSSFLDRGSNTYMVEWPGKAPDSSPLFEWVRVDYDLIETLGFEMAEGRSFSRNFEADTARVIVNQAAVNSMGMDEPIGRMIQINGVEREVIGVVEDFHYQDLRNEVEPLLMVLSPPDASIGFVRVETDDISQTLSRLEQVHAQVNPGFPFGYTFMDESYESLYRSEMRVGELSKYFALFAIFISCLGLLGLSAFTAEQRRKEIGIRKVLGAPVGKLVTMLSKDFTRLVLLAIVVATPVSWWMMNRWLNDYAYRIEIGIWPYLLAGGGALLIAWLTVSWQSVRVALMNPVESLRNE
ncbi:MAG: ABC transporter permease [Balneolaceae bacterium]